MKKTELSYKFYYVLGIILTFIFLFLFALFVTLPLAIKDFPEYLGRVAIVICMVSFVGIIFGVYLVKKANFIKINQRQNKEAEEVKERIKESYIKHHRYDENDEN